MPAYLRDGSAQTIVRATTLRQKLQIQLSISPSHSILTPGRPVPALTLWRQAPGRVVTGVPIFESLVWLDPVKIPTQAGFEPGIFRPRGGRLTTRPTRRCPFGHLSDQSDYRVSNNRNVIMLTRMRNKHSLHEKPLLFLSVIGDFEYLLHHHIEGSRPEWCISAIYHAWDTPFRSGTLELEV